VITLVLGGARSGKSAVAERLVTALVGDDDDVTYVATAVVDPSDADFASRIAEHRARRPPTWTTVESGPDLPGVLAGLDGPVLVDSLGTWVAGCGHDGSAAAPVDATALCDALLTRHGPTVVVSEEVGMGVHPSTEAGRRFRDTLGTVNAAVADVAGDVWLVVAGRLLPLARAES
jgi:adenosyl cobinamide kinase/adenosyl cobinamide phosphate guanylyltransferase